MEERAMATAPAAERWSEILDRQEASGLTLREFARVNGLNQNTLAWWRWELGRRRSATGRGFLEFLVAEPEPEQVTVEIALDGLAARVVVGEHTDLALVRRVLESLC